MHWTHHSRDPADHDSNFGVIFSVWDRLFGTYRLGARREEIRAGLDQYPSPDYVSLVPFYKIPLGSGCRSHPSR